MRTNDIPEFTLVSTKRSKGSILRSFFKFITGLLLVAIVAAISSVTTYVVMADYQRHGSLRPVTTIFSEFFEEIEKPAAVQTVSETETPVPQRTLMDDARYVWQRTREYTRIGWEKTKSGSSVAWDATCKYTGIAWDWTCEKSTSAWHWTKEKSGSAYEATRDWTVDTYHSVVDWFSGLFSAKKADAAELNHGKMEHVTDVFGMTSENFAVCQLRNSYWLTLDVSRAIVIDDPNAVVVDTHHVPYAQGEVLHPGMYYVGHRCDLENDRGDALTLSELLAIHEYGKDGVWVRNDSDTDRLLVHIYLATARFEVPGNVIDVAFEMQDHNWYFESELVNDQLKHIGWVELRVEPRQ